MSKRRLYFTNVQVYFECKTALHNEDSWVVKTKEDNITPEKIGLYGIADIRRPENPRRWLRFKGLLVDYTRRQLSYNDDIFNACIGLFHFVYGDTGSRFIYGLPESDFFDALRWFSEQSTTRVPERADLILPTWS